MNYDFMDLEQLRAEKWNLILQYTAEKQIIYDSKYKDKINYLNRCINDLQFKEGKKN